MIKAPEGGTHVGHMSYRQHEKNILSLSKDNEGEKMCLTKS